MIIIFSVVNFHHNILIYGGILGNYIIMTSSHTVYGHFILKHQVYDYHFDCVKPVRFCQNPNLTSTQGWV